MENTIYSWHKELVDNADLKSLRRESEGIRLLRTAGLANPGWIKRFLISIGDFMTRHGRNLRDKDTELHQARQLKSDKLAT